MSEVEAIDAGAGEVGWRCERASDDAAGSGSPVPRTAAQPLLTPAMASRFGS
jgi:hypothetical protein